MYSTGVNSELGTYRFCKPDSELTSEIGDSIQKHAGSRCAAAVRGVDGEAPHQKREKNSAEPIFLSVHIYIKDAECTKNE